MVLRAGILLAGAALLLARPRRRGTRGRAAAPCRVVIAGAGFGGLNAAMALAGRPGINLTVIDARNHHLFQPLLYQVATAALAPSDIASPLRGLLPLSGSTRVLMGTVTNIDPAARTVLWDGGAIPYDALIVATGSRPSYFGHGEWARAAPGLKTLDDALELRQQILTAFEHASTSAPADRRRLLTFVLIGGGATGVEMAGAIAELARDLLAHDYDMAGVAATIVLVEAGPRVLPEFAEDLSASAAAALRRLGVTIRTGSRVTGIADGVVTLDAGTIAAGMVIWTAGTEATPVARWLRVKPGRGGRVPVRADLSVPGLPGVYVIGDAAGAVDRRGNLLPGLAPVAKQQGQFVARRILRRRQGRARRFAYRDYGTLATIGRGEAVAAFGRVHLTGEAAWLTWAVAHIFFLIGFRNRIMVATQWAFAYVTHQRSDRIITGRLGVGRNAALRPEVANPG